MSGHGQAATGTERNRQRTMEHPAAAAWRKCSKPSGELERIDLMQQRTGKPTIYRMIGADPRGGDIIAKRCGTGTANTERFVYDEILPQIPARAIRCYGSAPDDDERYWWLFLEDAGGDPFFAECREHRELAGRWLGLLHTSAERIPAVAAYLPDRTARFYATLLETARDTTESILMGEALTPACASLLAAIVSRCQELAHHWSDLERLCDGMPVTLLHGDLGDQNARIRDESAGKT